MRRASARRHGIVVRSPTQDGGDRRLASPAIGATPEPPADSREARFTLVAMAIFACAIAVRLVHVWQMRPAPLFLVLMGDSRAYDEWARRIASGDWFGHEVFYQAPFYPYFLGLIYATVGRSLLLVRVVQAAIGSASCVLLALAARRLFSRRAGIAAGLMLAFYAPAIFFDGLVQKSVLDVFFVSLALWLIARILTVRPDAAATRAVAAAAWPWRWLSCWLWLGLTIGALSLTRENALVFVIVITAFALILTPGRTHGQATMRRRASTAGVFLLGIAVFVVPVAARNSRLGGGFSLTTAQFGPNFYIGNNPTADGTYQSLRFGRGAPEYERQDATELAELAVGHPLSAAEVSAYWTDRALQFVTCQPTAWLTLLARKMALVWNRAEMVDTEDQATHAEWSLPLRLAGPFGHFGILVPLAVFGAIVAWPMRSRLWVLYALVVVYAASVALFYVFARYRYPLVPLLLLFAAAGVTDARRWSRRVHGRAKAWTLVAVAATAGFANWPLVAADPRAVTENNLAVALQGEGRFEEATTHYERAIALRPDYAPAYSNMGTVLRATGHLDRAIAAYQRALQLQPLYPDADFNLGNALLDGGHWDAAAMHLRAALRAAPGSADIYNNLGIALAARNLPGEATAAFAAALRVDPDSIKAHRNLGDLLAGAGRISEALEHFRRAAALAPDDGTLHYDYGAVLLVSGRPVDAEAEFRAALRTMPTSAEGHNNLGIALGSQGRLEESIAEFRAAVGLKPGFADGQRNLAMALDARSRRRR